MLVILIHLNSASYAALQQGVEAPDGAPIFFTKLFILIYLIRASGAASQEGVAAPDRATDFFLETNIHLYLYEWCSRRHSTKRSRSTRQETRIYFFEIYSFKSILIVHHMPHQNKELQHQTGRHLTCLCLIYLNCA
jgi:hypothetical protein